MWFGTYGGGVSKFDGTDWTTYTTAQGLASNNVYGIGVDGAGHVWFATNGGGVSEFDGVNWTSYGYGYGPASSYVLSLTIDDIGRKWFGTAGGVSTYDGSVWKTFRLDDGLVHDDIWAIAIDALGHIWVGTPAGVSEYIPDGTSGVVTAAAGGSVASPDGSTILTFAPSALNSDLEIFVVPYASPPVDPLAAIGHAFDVHAVQAGTNGPSVETISGTYTISIEYTNEQVDSIDEKTLALYRWDGSQWLKEPSSAVDVAANTVTATPNHFSHWAVLGEPRADMHTVYLPVVTRSQ
jgi:hypothetical protein